MTPSRPVFRFHLEAGDEIGFGHLVRCQRLADLVKKKGYGASFVLSVQSPQGAAILAAAGFEVLQSEHPYDVVVANGCRTIVVVDAVHTRSMENIDRMKHYLADQRTQSDGLVFIDGGGSQAMRYRLGRSAWDVSVAPYVGEMEDVGVLAGPGYCILDADFEKIPPRICRTSATRVLLTCGGSDPHGLTLDALESLGLLRQLRLDVRVVLGRGFTDRLREDVRAVAASLHHSVVFVENSTRLIDHMHWADAAIATSGLTKYELAACGVPAILIALDEENWNINTTFLVEGTAWDGGYPGQFDAERLAKDLERLIVDAGERQAMARRGQSLVDGQGRHRILEKVEQLLAL
jgi:spore coat polysaccharide biosynthesis predicted glycosyltransferase SpsG